MCWLISQHFAFLVLSAAAALASQSPTYLSHDPPPTPICLRSRPASCLPFSAPLSTLEPARVLVGVTSGPHGTYSFAAAARYFNLASSFATKFQTASTYSPHFVESVTTDSYVEKSLCAAEEGADMGMLTRQLNQKEATMTDSITTYRCAHGDKNRTVIQIPAAVDALILTTTPDGPAANCIASLPGGGLTIDQLRWIYSNYTLNQLKATGWSPNALPNSDDSDSTHYWSELCRVGTNCSTFCLRREIKLAGLPIDLDLSSFIASTIFTDAANGETIEWSRYKYTNPTQRNYGRFGLGLMDFGMYNSSATYAASVQGKNQDFYAPCKETLQTGLYPLSRSIYMGVRSDNATRLDAMRPLVALLFSKPGDLIVSEHGFVPLSSITNNKVASYAPLRRDRKAISRNLLSVQCGHSGPITGAGNVNLYGLATLWASYYTTFCQHSTITIRKSDNNDGAAKLCGNNANVQVVDIALMDRKLDRSEAILQSNGFSYRCVKDPNHRLVNEIIVATKGTGVMVKQVRDGAAYECINSLGSLSLDQLRWIFSSFNTSQLLATGWDPNSLPKNDGNDNTHLWSELGGENCSDTEIRIAGPPISSSSVALFNEIVFNASMHVNNTSTHETIATQRPLGYFMAFGTYSQAAPKL